MTHAVSLLSRLKRWARVVKRDVIALWLAARDPRTPLAAKLVAAAIAAYALSPLDLIPDFIPVLGYLDDLLIVPPGILLAVALIPARLMTELRESASRIASRPTSRAGLIGVLAIWALMAALVGWWMWPHLPFQTAS